MPAPDKCTVSLKEVAMQEGLGIKALEKIATEHGYLIKVGSQKKLFIQEIEELFDKCRVNPKGRGSINSSTEANGISETRAGPTDQRVSKTLNKLKKPSRNTSGEKKNNVLLLNQPKSAAVKS